MRVLNINKAHKQATKEGEICAVFMRRRHEVELKI